MHSAPPLRRPLGCVADLAGGTCGAQIQYCLMKGVDVPIRAHRAGRCVQFLPSRKQLDTNVICLAFFARPGLLKRNGMEVDFSLLDQPCQDQVLPTFESALSKGKVSWHEEVRTNADQNCIKTRGRG
ncbi:hypothetical protein C8N36_103336 [Pelagimonas varians]|uniref:Uncharacterized protein n=1 Tax=Pelagimonas varians TaxID=696760 RepID=A0A238KTY9_9RHOB|nr:hypothetical protein C8N36_103336 [Pelagimonas varians]SMX46051.1 hypothetical protein PEV8663_03180 [Pelagimonas varians]